MRDAAAFSTHSNHLDHLIPVCAALEVPLVVPDDETVALVQRCYPPMTVIAATDPVGRDRLRAARVLLHSMRIPRQLMVRPEYRKARFVCCPHGWSDKAWWLKWMALEDVFLAYGPATLRMLEDEGTLPLAHRHVTAGDLRFAFYVTHQAWFDAIAHDDVFAQLEPDHRIALYAPTWSDIEDASSLEAALGPLTRSVPPGWNLIIKLHPFTSREVTQQVLETVRPLAGRATVLPDHPLVYPFLSRADVYIGDRSSMGYAFLHFDRPIFLLRPDGYVASRHDLLTRCSTEVAETDLPAVWDAITSSAPGSDAPARAAVRDQVFAPVSSVDRLRAEIDAACQGDLPRDPGPLPAEFRAQRQRLTQRLPNEAPGAITLAQILSVREPSPP